MIEEKEVGDLIDGRKKEEFVRIWKKKIGEMEENEFMEMVDDVCSWMWDSGGCGNKKVLGEMYEEYGNLYL